MRKFYDTETGATVTLGELQEIYNGDPVLRDEYPKFGNYVAAAQTYNGGTLEEMK